jgi:hypothetical protein
MTDPIQPRLEVWHEPLWADYWRHAVQRMFGHQLEQLHDWPYLDVLPGDVSREDDQRSRVHAQFYRLFPRVQAAYHLCAHDLGSRVLPGQRFAIQRVPTFRVHFPRSRAVGEPHTDWQYGHQAGEVTIWMPLTPAHNTATMWVAERAEGWDPAEFHKKFVDLGGEKAFESLPGPLRMWPVNLDVGEVLVWDSVLRSHGNLLNHEGMTEWLELKVDDELMKITAAEGADIVNALDGQPLKIRRSWWEGPGISRVSMDFRVLPWELLEADSDRRSVNTGTPMTLGTPEHPGYWLDLADLEGETWPLPVLDTEDARG